MRVLAIDTATEACSVALLSDGDLRGRCEEVGRGHADVVLDMVDAVLADAGCRLGMLDGIAGSIGPGSFTGVRICVSVVQGLACGAGLPVVGVTTLEALALRALRDGAAQAMACLDARMGEVYWARFAADSGAGLMALGDAAVSSPAAVAGPASGPWACVGRGFAAYPQLAALPGAVLAPGADRALPDARHMAVLGALRFAAGQGVDPAALAPRYLRDKVALTERERDATQTSR